MKDLKCSICKAELEEILVTKNKQITWEEFNNKLRKKAIRDEEDRSIFYDSEKAWSAGMELRSLTCLMYQCTNSNIFPNVESLRRHLEQVHQRTFCKICLKGRAIFIREQRIYHTQKLRSHIENGDTATERGAEILPHPWCDFCEEFFYDAQAFEKHLNQLHLTCNLCGDF
jgi:E3 ubiquitin-protein ligase ZNF598